MTCFDDYIRAKFTDVIRTEADMHAYQGEAFEFLRDNPFSHLFIDLGLGKTVTSLTLIAYLLRNFTPGKILVTGPLRVMTDTWPTEIRLWEHTAPFNYTLIREDDDDPRIKAAAARDRKESPERSWEREVMQASGYEEKEIMVKLGPSHETRARQLIRAELAHSPTSIHFINKEQLEWLVNLHREKWPYRTVIIDELSLFKDYSTHAFKALAKVRRTPGLITRLHGLTATPTSESYEHLWAQMYLADLGERLGKNITTYRNKYFISSRWTRKLTLREDAEQEILDKIKDITLVMKAEDYLDLEKPTFLEKPIHLSQREMDLYREMEKKMVVTLEDGTVIESDNAAALCGKLQQMASGVLYETASLGDWETEDIKKVKVIHNLHDHKIETLKEIVASLDGEPIIIAYHFKSSLDRLKKAFPKAVVMDKDGKCVKAWNAKKIPILLIHPKSGGHGLNLQHGGHHMAFYDLPWSLDSYTQLIGRLARQGQLKPVMVFILLAVGTIDEVIYSALQQKGFVQDNFFSVLKSLIRAYRKSFRSTQSVASIA